MMNLDLGERYKKTDLYRTLKQTQSITPSTTHEEFKMIPNHQTTSNTWDARHLDKFLNTTEWGATPIIQKTINSNYGADRSPQMRSPKNASSGSPKSFLSQKSHFFKTGPRFAPEREKEYIQNNFKDYSYKEIKNKVNALVSNSKIPRIVTQHQYKRHFELPATETDKTKLEFTFQNNGFMSPQERRQQVLDIKKNQIEFQAQKDRMKTLQKRYRVYRGAYPQGVTGVDHPMEDDTMIYKQEHDKLASFFGERDKIEAMRKKELENRVKTNAILEFHNKNFNEKLVLPPKRIVEKNGKIPVKENFIVEAQDTHNRLFTGKGTKVEKFNIDRAYYLKNQASKGRNWDIISWVNTDLDIKAMKSDTNPIGNGNGTGSSN